MIELWQLYDEQGRALEGQGATKDAVFKGLLHGASHVWIWRNTNNGIELLLQKRAAHKRTWPNLLDISAAGHIALGEEPLFAAIRETKEEIGLDVTAADFKLIAVDRHNIVASGGEIENEFCWVYLLQLKSSNNFTLQKSEVSSLEWVKFAKFKKNTLNDTQNKYVPHGPKYYITVISAIDT